MQALFRFGPQVESDAFVRRTLGDDGFRGAVPKAADPEAEPVSVLLHEAILPEFVRLDHPDDENVVTRVMNLDVDTNKFDLLVSMGRVTQQDDFTEDDLVTMEQALDNLVDLEGVEGVEQYIEQYLL